MTDLSAIRYVSTEMHELPGAVTRHHFPEIQRKKDREAIRLNAGVHVVRFNFETPVMLYQKGTGKLEARWRELFMVPGYTGVRTV